MSLPAPTRHVVHLDHGRARVDLDARQLIVAGQAAKLGSRAFDLLVALLDRHERVVSKQELLDVVWPGLVVEENNLQVHVMTLRRLLGAAAIATVSGRGYRLTLAITLASDVSDISPATINAGLPGATQATAPALAMLAAKTPPVREPLLGREALIAEALDRLSTPGVRLLTLVGPGGSGKTRVALHVAALRASQLDDGATTVLLAPVRDPSLIVTAIAAAVGLQEAGRAPLAEQLCQYLAPRRLLLLLDNLEHLPAAGEVLAMLLAACPLLQVLATSRAALHLGDEELLRVPPLALPVDDSVAAWLAAPATQLFANRAAACGRPISGRADERAAVAEICRRVDGLPLAIELAAARLRLLTPTALVARLQQSLPLLKGGAADAPARQQALRATIAWSHDLLDAAAQRLFRRLSVFAGGWTLDAAERLDLEHDGCLDALEQLLDHNLAQRVDDVDGEPRYAMLETIREFALEQLTACGEEAAVRERHAQAMLALARSCEPRITSAMRRPALQRLHADINNLRGALAWWLQQRPDVTSALPLAGALAWLWYFEGLYKEGRGWLEQALALPDGAAFDRATALSGAARMAAYSADVPAALTWSAESIALWRTLDANAPAHRRGLSFALLLNGIAHCMATHYEAAQAPLREALALQQALADPWGIALSQGYLGVSQIEIPGRVEPAERLMLESTARFVALHDPWGCGTTSHYLSTLAMRRGDWPRARELGEAALASSRELGDRFRIARNLHQLAEIDLADGQLEAALTRLDESLRINLEQGRLGDAAQQLRLLAREAASRGRPQLALRFAAMAAPHAAAARTMPHDDPQAHAALLARLRAQLPPSDWQQAWALGSATPVTQAMPMLDELAG